MLLARGHRAMSDGDGAAVRGKVTAPSDIGCGGKRFLITDSHSAFSKQIRLRVSDASSRGEGSFLNMFRVSSPEQPEVDFNKLINESRCCRSDGSFIKT